MYSTYTGLPVTVGEPGGAVWGAGNVLAPGDALIPNGTLPHMSVNSGVAGTACSGTQVGTATTGATGTGLNVFGDPGAAFCTFSQGFIQIATDGRTGNDNPMRGLARWNVDMRLAKDTAMTEKLKLGLSADFFNVFNHHNFSTPNLDITNPAQFGEITSTITLPNRVNSARFIELGMRLDF